MSTGTEGREKLIDSLRNREYRHFFRKASYKRGLAEQIREMRLKRGWTQADLAESSGKVQETISQLEKPDYGNYTLKTLDRLAEAFDVALIVKFAPFSELADWMTDLSPEDLAVPDFDHDPGLASTPEGRDVAARADYVQTDRVQTDRVQTDRVQTEGVQTEGVPQSARSVGVLDYPRLRTDSTNWAAATGD